MEKPFVVRKRSVLLASERILNFDKPIEDYRIVNNILIVVFEVTDKVDPQNVMAIDGTGKILWRKSSWVRGRKRSKGFNDPYVGIGCSQGEVHLFSGSCHRVTIRPEDGKVVWVAFTK